MPTYSDFIDGLPASPTANGTEEIAVQQNASSVLMSVQSILIPGADNTYTLGSATKSYAQMYLGSAHAPVLNGGIIGYWPPTPAETAAGVTPTNYAYPELWVERYGADPTGSTDSGVAFRNACLVAAQKTGGIIRAYGNTYLFNTWDAVSFYSTNNLAIFLLPKNTELCGGGQFFTNLLISQTARTGMYNGGANRTHIIGMAKNTGGQYIHDLAFNWNGIVQAAANDYCYDVRTCAGNCIIERCYSAEAPITNAVADSSTDTANGNSPLGPTVVRDCWFQDSGPNMTGNSAINGDCSYIYLAAPDSKVERNRIFNTAIANHNCGGIELHCARYYATENFILNCWPGMYVGVQDGVTISVGSVIDGNYIGYCLSGISIVDQHTGLKIVNNYFEANDDSSGAGFGHNFTDLFTPLNSSDGTNTAGTQTGFIIANNTFNQTLYRQGTPRSTSGTAAAQSVSINLSVVDGLSIHHNEFINAMPSCIGINGSVTGNGQSIVIEENTFLDCASISGSTGYIDVLASGSSGWASGPVIRDVFIRHNNLWRSGSYSISTTLLGIATAGGTPAGTLTNIRYEANYCDNVNATLETISLTGQGQVALNGADQVGLSLTTNGQSIPTGFPIIVCSAGAAYTGLIMDVGVADGQVCTVINASSYAQTMAASGTSNVADGASCIISANTSLTFTWNASGLLWYHN